MSTKPPSSAHARRSQPSLKPHLVTYEEAEAAWQRDLSQLVSKSPKFSEMDRDTESDAKPKPAPGQQLDLAVRNNDDVPLGHSLAAVNPPEAELEPRQLRALQLILEGTALGQVADAIGVDRRTIYRWRRQSSFRRELDALRRDLRESTRDRLHLLLPEAMEIVQKSIASANGSDAYRAASFIIRNALASDAKSRKSSPGPADALRTLLGR